MALPGRLPFLMPAANLTSARRGLVRLSALLCLAIPWTARADSASEEGAKAGFVYNFVKYTEWPLPAEGAGAAPLQICTPGGRPLDGQLALLQGRPLQGREINIRLNVRSGDWEDCHALFLAGEDRNWAAAAVRAAAVTPLLTIGDLPGFAQAGGMIELKTVGNRMRFDVNLAAAQRAGLRLSSQMLKLANQVLQ